MVSETLKYYEWIEALRAANFGASGNLNSEENATENMSICQSISGSSVALYQSPFKPMAARREFDYQAALPSADIQSDTEKAG